eukprot:4219776-Lingulodinium_polyedra.AAC.1
MAKWVARAVANGEPNGQRVVSSCFCVCVSERGLYMAHFLLSIGYSPSLRSVVRVGRGQRAQRNRRVLVRWRRGARYRCVSLLPQPGWVCARAVRCQGQPRAP